MKGMYFSFTRKGEKEMKFVTKKALKIENEQYAEQLKTIICYNAELADKVESMLKMYPFNVDDVVYELILKNNKGRFTKSKPSREHSIIEEVLVTKKNYFSLVDRYNEGFVFTTLDDAEAQLKSLCN